MAPATACAPCPPTSDPVHTTAADARPNPRRRSFPRAACSTLVSVARTAAEGPSAPTCIDSVHAAWKQRGAPCDRGGQCAALAEPGGVSLQSGVGPLRCQACRSTRRRVLCEASMHDPAMHVLAAPSPWLPTHPPTPTRVCSADAGVPGQRIQLAQRLRSAASRIPDARGVRAVHFELPPRPRGAQRAPGDGMAPPFPLPAGCSPGRCAAPAGGRCRPPPPAHALAVSHARRTPCMRCTVPPVLTYHSCCWLAHPRAVPHMDLP